MFKNCNFKQIIKCDMFLHIYYLRTSQKYSFRSVALVTKKFGAILHFLFTQTGLFRPCKFHGERSARTKKNRERRGRLGLFMVDSD